MLLHLNLIKNLITSYYTIQFIHRVRADLIKNIYESLNWGGGFSYLKKLASDAISRFNYNIIFRIQTKEWISK